MYRARACCIAAGSLLAFAASAVEDFSSTLASNRALAGHIFQISNSLPGPFSDTAFGTETVIGVGNAHSGTIEVRNVELGNLDYPLLAAGQGFDFSLSLTPDFAVRLFAAGAAYSATTARGAVVTGTVAAYDVHGSVIWGHNLGKQVRGALVLDAGTRPSFSILVANAILDFLDTGQVGGVDVLQSSSTVYVAPGVSLAAALHPSFGLLGEARFLWTRRATGTDPQDVREGVILAGQAEFDMDPLWHIPVAVTALTRLETRFSTNGINRTLDLGGGIYYTRRLPLQLGLEVTRRSGELRREPAPSLTLSMAIASIVLRYHW